MKNQQVRLVALSSALTLVTAGCPGLLEALRSSVFQEPSLSFRTASLTDISLAGLTLDTIWSLHNPNSIGVSLTSVDYALSIEGKRVVSGAPATGLNIGPAGTSELHFPAAIRFADLAAVVETFLTKDTASYRVEGRLGVDTPIGVVQLPLSYESAFEVPKLPQVAFGNPRVTNLNLTGATIEFPLQVTNRNTYSLPVNGLSGTISIGGSPVGTLSTGDLGAMGGKATRSVALPLTIHLLSAASAVMTAVQGGNAQVSFNARVQSGRAALPLTVRQGVDFLR